MQKTSSKNFKYFKGRVLYYIKELGLLDYEVFFDHESIEPGDTLYGADAGLRIHLGNRQATFVLDKEWSIPVNNNSLSKAAFHEVVHLLIYEFYVVSTERGDIASRRLAAAEHALIRRLENFMFRRDL